MFYDIELIDIKIGGPLGFFSKQNFFDKQDNIDNYINMTKDYDPGFMMMEIRRYLKRGSSLLELGMGPGKDFDVLKEYFKAVGSDSSLLFLDRYKELDSQASLLQVDVLKMDVSEQFDCIFSNKVLHHIKKKQLVQSLQRQWEKLNSGGILFHTFWYGEGQQKKYGNVLFVYYNEETIKTVIDFNQYEVLNFKRYTEIEDNDSFYIVLRKK